MEILKLQNEQQIQEMRSLIRSLPHGPTVSAFDEVIQLVSVRQNTRLWYEHNELTAFAYVDDFNNLCFEISPHTSDASLERAITDWGVSCIRNRNRENGESAALDSSCSGKNIDRIQMLERNGFIQLEIRSLQYSRSLSEPIRIFPLPSGYQIRCVKGEEEIESLVALHRAAFGTDNMTAEYRQAMMRTPQYAPDMDWLVVAPDEELAAFCIGGFEEPGSSVGFVDPVGTHPTYQKKGLAAALMSAGILALKQRGAATVQFGTSSENLPMQKLAASLGFTLVSESVWFSQEVN